jgi:cytochrome oxidase Cu insertion factor (SCO1/SenC/PrrC family)
MLKLLVGTSLASAAAFSPGAAAVSTRGVSRAAVSMANFHDFSATALDGSKVDMSSFKGKPILILNIASL